ncbi:YeeE/YedE thiosulfate transporter family protein [uncultured Planktomarina sp.]|uniref:YeeE/YedE thiosulfate transporter family protein n=1 Tax=uncultured Planktomarina sp. TaxID=1538529 RepID=UPI0032608310
MGAALMGVGGVLAGGCTVGADLAGIASLSIAAIIELAAIALGGWAMRALLAKKKSTTIGAH